MNNTIKFVFNKLSFVCLITASLLAFSSCKKASRINESLAIAPADMTGKTLKVDGATIRFSSNTSATISDYIGTATRSSVSYNRTSELTADLNFFYHTEDKRNMSERDYTVQLKFANENQGLATGSYTYKLTIQKGTKYEKSDSGSKTFSDRIFSIN